MTDLKFTSPSGETTIKFEDTGRIGTVAPKTQLHIKMDEPVKYEKPMTAIEDIEAQIKVLQSKLEFYKELENHKTPCEEAYNRVYKYKSNITWIDFEKGYIEAQKDYKVGEYQETAQKRGERLHKDVERVVKENMKWFEENPDKDPLDWVKPQTPKKPAKDKVPLYKRFVKEDVGCYGCLYYSDALKVVKEFFIDEAVIENQDHEYVTFTLQKSLLEVPND